MSQTPLRFHATFADDVSITNNSTTAHRFDATHTGIVFTSRPLAANEKLSLKISDALDKHKDLVSIGFTPHPPDKNHKPTNAIKIHSLLKNHYIKTKILSFYVTQTGRIHFNLNGAFKRQVGSVQTFGVPLWAFVLIHGAPSTVDLVNSSPPDTKLESPLSLHQTRGFNVHVADNIANKDDKHLTDCYAFTDRPLRPSHCTSVKIKKTNHRGSGRLRLGLTTCNPSDLAQEVLPESFDALFKRNEWWIDVSDGSWTLKQDDIISFVVSKKGKMQIWRNAATMLHEVQITQHSKLWAVFGFGDFEKIKVMSAELQEEKTRQSRAKIIEDVMEMTDHDEGDSDCVVCCEAAADTALCPCGHLCMCGVCARKVWRRAGQGRCPVCRAAIKNILKIYKM